MKIKALVGALFLASVCHSQEKTTFHPEPLPVRSAIETTALGYGNGRKLVSTPDGTMYFSAVSKAPNGLPGVCVIRTVRRDPEVKPTFESVWIENSNGLFVSADMHFASSLGAYGAGPFYVLWTGGDQSGFNDARTAHQLRFAKINTESTMAVTEVGQPFTVTGFSEAYRPPYKQSQLWQEFPSSFVSKDGKLHVVWEARSRMRKTQNDFPIPAIAYAVRDAAGHWSVHGDIETPPYLDVKSIKGAQYRPFMVTDGQDTLHVVCYGEVNSRLQILYGRLVNDEFSGWTPIAPSRNDQRHVTMAIDNKGRLHAAWREANLTGKQSFIAYSMRNTDGVWTPMIRVDNPYRNGSTPNITVDDNAAYVVWTSWPDGFENSDAQKNNGIPNDIDTVEGDLEFAYKRFNDETFSPPVPLTGGTGSYPRIARVAKTNPSKLSAIWSLGRECLPHACVQIYFSEFAAPVTK